MNFHRYGLPQKSVAIGPIAFNEAELPARIFGETQLKDNLSSLIAPNPLPIFCRNEWNEEFHGDSISDSSMKFCNDFYLAPTHTGICMSKNLDLKEIMKLDDSYNDFFEVENQSSKLKVEKNNYWAVSSFVINAMKSDLKQVCVLVLYLLLMAM